MTGQPDFFTETAVTSERKVEKSFPSFWVIFLMVRTIPPSFVEIGPKLRVVALLMRQWPKTAKNRGEPQKMTPSSETENFLGVVPMGKLEPRV